MKKDLVCVEWKDAYEIRGKPTTVIYRSYGVLLGEYKKYVILLQDYIETGKVKHPRLVGIPKEIVLNITQIGVVDIPNIGWRKIVNREKPVYPKRFIRLLKKIFEKESRYEKKPIIRVENKRIWNIVD